MPDSTEPPAAREPWLGRSAIFSGAALAVAVSLAVIGAWQVVRGVLGVTSRSNLVFLFYLVILGGLTAGGKRAGRLRTDAPLTHGALAAIAAYALVAALTSAIRAATGQGTDPVEVIFHGFMSASAGILGGLLSTRRAQPSANPDETMEGR